MNQLDQARRSLLLCLGGLGITQALLPSDLSAQRKASHGHVLSANEGEHLIHFRDRGNIFIKLGTANGSDDLALGTQQVMAGSGIPIHRHFQMGEAFYVL